MFFRAELFERVKTVRAIIIAAFVHNDVETGFPAEQRALAMRTIIFGFSRSFITVVDTKS